VRAWSNLHRYDPSRPFGTWLFTIAARLATNAARDRRRFAGEPAEAFANLPADGDPFEHACRKEDRINLWALAEHLLDPVPRSALWLFYAEDRSCLEIAGILGRSEGAIRVILHRARRRLASHLGDEGATSRGSDASLTPRTARKGCRHP